jgi:hypothetical protein
MEKKIKYLLRIIGIGLCIIALVAAAVIFLPSFVIKTQQKINNNEEKGKTIELLSANGLKAELLLLENYEVSTSSNRINLTKKEDQIYLQWLNKSQVDELIKREIIGSQQSDSAGLVRNDYSLAQPLEGDLDKASIIWSGEEGLLVAYDNEALNDAEKLLSTISISISASVASSTDKNVAPITKKPTFVKKDGYIVSLFFPKWDSADCSQTSAVSIKITDIESELGLIPSVVKILMQYPKSELDKAGLKPLFDDNVRLLSYGYNYNIAILNFSELLRASQICPLAMVKKSLLQSLSSLSASSNLQVQAVDVQVNGQKLK